MDKTILSSFDQKGGACTGFDYLRIFLSIFILFWHSVWNATGSRELDSALWSGHFRFIPASALPMFFALSGFLFSGSLQRVKLHQFIILRAIRLIPALAVETILCALLLGPLVTSFDVARYFGDGMFWHYFLNIIGIIHYGLPGVFEHNIGGHNVNTQLWTIPFELECYLSIIFMAVFGLNKRRSIIIICFPIATMGLIASQFLGNPIDPTAHVPGEMLVLSFLAGVIIHQYADLIPYSTVLTCIAGVLTCVMLQYTQVSYLAALPAAYFTVGIGLLRLPRIPFGDLSYGIFLFHFPIQQTIMHFYPGIHHIYQLTVSALAASMVMAWLSWNLVESRILKRKKVILRQADTIAERLARSTLGQFFKLNAAAD